MFIRWTTGRLSATVDRLLWATVSYQYKMLKKPVVRRRGYIERPKQMRFEVNQRLFVSCDTHSAAAEHITKC